MFHEIYSQEKIKNMYKSENIQSEPKQEQYVTDVCK